MSFFEKATPRLAQILGFALHLLTFIRRILILFLKITRHGTKRFVIALKYEGERDFRYPLIGK